MTAKCRTTVCRRDRGVVLVIALIVVAMLSLGAYTFANLMITERESVALYDREASGGSVL